MKNLKPLKELLSSYDTNFLKKHFSVDKSDCCLTRFFGKTFK